MLCKNYAGTPCRFLVSAEFESESNCRYGTILFWAKDQYNRVCAIVRDKESGRCRTVIADNIWIDIDL